MIGFRNALHNTGRFARTIYSTTHRVAGNIDRGLGSAARLYKTMSPVLAPIARELMGDQRAGATDKAIRDAMAGYGNVRSRVIEAHRMGDALTSMVRKEIPPLQLN